MLEPERVGVEFFVAMQVDVEVLMRAGLQQMAQALRVPVRGMHEAAEDGIIKFKSAYPVPETIARATRLSALLLHGEGAGDEEERAAALAAARPRLWLWLMLMLMRS